jgi:ABC-2 type transport system permease protein
MSDRDTSVIHDIGYRRYEGPRLGRGYAVRSLYTHSLRTAFGIGRGFKSKIFSWAVVGAVTLIAVVITAVSSQEGERVVTYLEFVDATGAFAMLFLAVVAPELTSRDLRARVLALYFARPLGRSDYVGAKLAALVTATVLVLGGPQLVIFAGMAFDAGGVKQVWGEFTDLSAGLLYTAIYALVTASLALLVASFTGRRAFAAAGIVAVFLVTVPIAGVIQAVGGRTGAELAGLVNPAWLVMGIGGWLFDHHSLDVGDFGPLYGAVAILLVATCTALLLARYRRVER